MCIRDSTNSIRYKSWDFSITARASIGNYAYNNLASNAVFNAAASVNNILNNIHSDYLSTGFIDFTENSLLSDHYIQFPKLISHSSQKFQKSCQQAYHF